MPQCFKCEKEIESAIQAQDAWETPSGAVQFDGGFGFGSAIYDALVDNRYVQVIICDDCLVAHKLLTKEIQK
jgi:hypothetical protein